MMTTIRRPDRDPPLTLALSRVGHRCVLHATGEIDLSVVGALTGLAANALSDGAQELWLDLSAVEFIDVVGAHSLVELQQRARDEGRRLAVICPVPVVRRTLDLTGAAQELPLFDSRSQAHRLA